MPATATPSVFACGSSLSARCLYDSVSRRRRLRLPARHPRDSLTWGLDLIPDGREFRVAVDDVERANLVGSVRPLHPQEQTVVEMLQGRRNQQLSRSLQFATIDARVKRVQRFIEYSNEFPWAWTVAMVD